MALFLFATVLLERKSHFSLVVGKGGLKVLGEDEKLQENKSGRYVFPFTALLGQEKMKKALLLNAVNPHLGGVLIRGEKGTAKSTAVRALAALLPEIPVVPGCPYQCNPFEPHKLCSCCLSRYAAGESLPVVWRRVQVVDLPVSATEDRVVGSLDFEYAVKHGGRRFEPGLLARAHRGILYIDEVNLLDDHLVDLLLDAAASGVNFVEREGISYSHPAEFILVGTMNPEEGELRPQLLDRFGLCVQVEGETDPAVRVEIIKRREAFDQDPLGFLAQWAEEEERVRQAIIAAQRLLPEVVISPELEELVTRVCTEARVAGHRADLVMAATARTLAAWYGRREVTAEDVYEAAEFVLPHRMREAPPPQQPEPPEPEELEEPENTEEEEDQQESQEQQEQSPPEMEESQQEEQKDLPPQPTPPRDAPETIFAVGEPFSVRRISFKEKGMLRRGSGRRSRGQTATKSGRYVRSTLRWARKDLAFDATLRAAAPYQRRRKRDGVAVVIEVSDFREKVREKRIGNFLLFVVDASGSMGAQQRMVEAKGAVLSLLLDAYQKRDRVGMVAFRGDRAEVLLPPTNSVERAQKLLAELPTGGRTPLSAGLLKAYEVAKAHLFKDPDLRPLLIIISDGKANVSLGEERPLAEAFKVAELIREEERIRSLVVDVENDGFLSFGLAHQLAVALDADYYKLNDLRAERLLEAVHGALAEI
ncbi:putative cobaltochelatase [Calderihabitans maritimus]|uniref:putative cobaltochelatase n=1 Tax=Calderihabitans maritimus TaxID=1246530 RepID=UPI001EE01CC4|nr:putative cobaltochelatase [Calderihabitans maritimus]